MSCASKNVKLTQSLSHVSLVNTLLVRHASPANVNNIQWERA